MATMVANSRSAGPCSMVSQVVHSFGAFHNQQTRRQAPAVKGAGKLGSDLNHAPTRNDSMNRSGESLHAVIKLLSMTMNTTRIATIGPSDAARGRVCSFTKCLNLLITSESYTAATPIAILPKIAILVFVAEFGCYQPNQ